MTAKLKKKADTTSITSSIKDSTRDIWLAGLGAFAKAQQEGGKIFNGLVEEGTKLESSAKKDLGESYDSAKSGVDGKVTGIKNKVSTQWDKVEKVFEDRVARALSRLGVPTQSDIKALSDMVASLTEEVRELNAAKAKLVSKAKKAA